MASASSAPGSPVLDSSLSITAQNNFTSAASSSSRSFVHASRAVAKKLLRAGVFVAVYAINVPRVLALFYLRSELYVQALAVRSQNLTLSQFNARFPKLSRRLGQTTVQHVLQIASKHRMDTGTHPSLTRLFPVTHNSFKLFV